MKNNPSNAPCAASPAPAGSPVYYHSSDGLRHAIKALAPDKYMVWYDLDDSGQPRGWTGARSPEDGLRILASLAPGITPE